MRVRANVVGPLLIALALAGAVGCGPLPVLLAGGAAAAGGGGGGGGGE
jgi:hypothetical protein